MATFAGFLKKIKALVQFAIGFPPTVQKFAPKKKKKKKPSVLSRIVYLQI
jgi:hypothetical protein